MRAALLLALLAGCYVTRAPTVDERPYWRITTGDAYDAGCLTARAFVRKSGREGLGVAVQLRSRRDCAVAITSAHLAIGPRTADAPPPAPVAMSGRSQLYAWLPLRFDGLAAWNAGDDRATLVVAMTIDGAPAPPWTLALVDAMDVKAEP